MSARGDAGDSTRKRSSRKDALQGKQSVTDDQQSGNPGGDSTEGDDCGKYVADIVEYFYGLLTDYSFTDEAKNHIQRTAAWAICYAYETSSNKSDEWWDGPEGEKYWQRHACRIASILQRNDPQCRITGKMVQAAIDEHAPRFVARLRNRLNTLEMRAFEAAILPETDPPSAATPAPSRLSRDAIVNMLSGCPYVS